MLLHIYFFIGLVVFFTIFMDMGFQYFDVRHTAEHIRSTLGKATNEFDDDGSLVAFTFSVMLFSSVFWFLLLLYWIYRKTEQQ